ncbi:hypothetical protein KCU81_g8609, partial [Aureobasidium melanogenum]|uniref:Uncharacterized protein n=1 Tax=Aureobasidium melanogenum (strain CBS 110374) TaxID=1043003 RepID=A0A074VVD8_AURM1
MSPSRSPRIEFMDEDPNTQQPGGPSFDYTRYRNMLDTYTRGEVLILLDCCYASAAIAGHDGPEILAACPWYDVASSDPARCFTTTLNTALTNMNGAPCKVADLYTVMKRDPTYMNMTVSPIHVLGAGKSQSVTLAKCTGQNTVAQVSRSKRIAQQHGHATDRVVLTVHIVDVAQGNDIQQWIQWLTRDVPNNIASIDVKVEVIAAHRSESIQLLFSVPTWVWTCMDPTVEAISFVSHVRGHNFLPPPTPRPVGMPLRQVRQNQNENRSLGGHKHSASMG